MKVVAIDHGYDAVKIYTGNNLISFKSRIEETNESINKNNTFKIIYNGNSYIVGDGAANQYIEYDKTANEYNKVFTLAGLSKVMDFDKEEFQIVAGYPLNLYSSNKNIFAKYLKTSEVQFVIDGIPKRIRINDCQVFPQGAGALFSNPYPYRNKVVCILDIGGMTVNGSIFHNLNLQTPSMFTINQGMIILYNKLMKALNNEFSMNIQEYEIPSILKDGLSINGERRKCNKLIDDILLAHCNSIKAECRKHNWNIETLDILVTGGGALVLDGYMQQVFPQAHIVDDPVFANVRGFYEIGRRYYA
jgi:plasmid segregation protein ParM